MESLANHLQFLDDTFMVVELFGELDDIGCAAGRFSPERSAHIAVFHCDILCAASLGVDAHEFVL